MPPMIRQLILINVIVFLVQNLINVGFTLGLFALIPSRVVEQGMVWQLFTYMFLHGGFGHLLFNMFGLWMFGRELEYWWGSKEFLRYYLVTGVGAGIIHLLTAFAFGNPNVPTVGASGAIFGILLAYGLYFPNRQVLLYFMFPVSARTMVIMFGVLELVMGFGSPNSGIARFAHLGGMLVGAIYLNWGKIKNKFRPLVAKGMQQTQSRRPGHRDPVISHEEEMERKAELDRILAKISREGMGSLTDGEKQILEESARRGRNREKHH